MNTSLTSGINTSSVTDTISDTFTDTVPRAIAEGLHEVGSYLDAVPDLVVDSVGTGVTEGRRFARRAADRIPGVTTSGTDRRWWIVAAILGLAAVAGVVWFTRRSSDQRTDAGQADIADIDARRSVA